MNKTFLLILTLAIVAFSSPDEKQEHNLSAGSNVTITNLRAEFLYNPAGIDTKQPRLSWEMESKERGIKQIAYQVIVSSSMEKLSRGEYDIWDSHKMESDNSINILYEGKPLESGMECFWKVQVWDNKGNILWSQMAKWSMGLLSKKDWNASWIGLDRPMGSDNPDTLIRQLSARFLRTEFGVEKKIKRATAYICGLGLFELYINGQKIGDQVLAPALSDYSKRAFYMTFDVTKNILEGKNAIGAILGNGSFFAPRLIFAPNESVHEKTATYGFPKMILRLDIEYTNNTQQHVFSDPTWKITTDGPIIANNEYDGEIYDARKEMPGWDKPGFDDSKWMKAEKVTDPSEKLSSQMIEPSRINETVKPISIKEIKPNVYVFDMGQNMVGWSSLDVQAKSGTKIQMRFAETLTPEGGLFVGNLRTAKQTDIYITKGEQLEHWEPRFTYHGFRYIELTGYPGKPDLNTITGKVVNDDFRVTGNFKCSNDIINRVYQAAYWTIRGNYHSVPTDCPQRDERQAWLGDRSVNSYGESFIFDNNKLYENWLTLISDAQRESGSIPDVAPPYWSFYSDNMTWPSSSIFIPDNLYRQFGNVKVIARNYQMMKKWLFYMRDTFMKDYLLPRDLYGDWCIPPRSPTTTIWSQDTTMITPHDYLGSVYFYYCLKLMEHHAQLLDKKDDAKEYSLLSAKVRDAINETYLNKKSLYYANNTITANALALSFGIPGEGIRKEVFHNLSSKLTDVYKNHTSTGLVGGQWIMRTLTDNGRPDLAYKLATNKDYPSWGYMLEQGATTIWELWNGNTGDPLMNSGNHVMLLGDFIVWCYEDLAGIKTDYADPGYKHIILKPIEVSGLDFVTASYHSSHGLIQSAWNKKNQIFNWDITIPPNTSATIYIPSQNKNGIMESGTPIQKSLGVEFLRMEEGKAVIKIASGNYHFTSK